MVFSSLIFLFAFLPLSLFLYFIINNRTYRNTVLIITSLAFYAWGEPVWVILLVFTSFFDYANGLIAERYRGRWQSRAALITSVTGNLLVLGFFKYSTFFAENLNFLFKTHLPQSHFNLPIGISFYTFQTLSYVIDVYRGEVEAQRSPFKLLLFVSLFHQLVAGPIVRYKDIAHDIDHRKITAPMFSYGINRFVIGLGKKVLLANAAGEVAALFLDSDMTKLSVLGAWFGIMMFALQIYFDFSGYSDMAIGLGRMFGFTYRENFDYPYISRSATEFWRRWHISLGSFFRDYLYIPLGGNRRHAVRNLLIVWFLTGFWHGASWNFILWGLYYGVLIILEKKLLGKLLEHVPGFIPHIYAVLAILTGWVLFYYIDLGKALSFLKIMFGFSGHVLIDTVLEVHFTNNLLFLVLAILASTPLFKVLSTRAEGYMECGSRNTLVLPGVVHPAFNLAVLCISAIMLVGKTYNPFMYFRF